MNELFNVLGGGNLSPMVRQFQQFRNAFRGDPRQQVQMMLNSGRITQAQFDRAAQIANQLHNVMR